MLISLILCIWGKQGQVRLMKVERSFCKKEKEQKLTKELKVRDCKKIELLLARLLRLQDMSIKKLDTILEYS